MPWILNGEEVHPGMIPEEVRIASDVLAEAIERFLCALWRMQL